METKLEFQWRELVFEANDDKSGFQMGDKLVTRKLLYKGLKCESAYKVGDNVLYDSSLPEVKTIAGKKYHILLENKAICKID